ncbi:MAG: hypothetical protein IVW54_19145 [Candidatus Binataceae bacterium]|nr:hypothetical protein [Candidatus Binataceae bacterium]
MNQASALTVLIAGVLLALTVALQTRHISRLWLRWIPRPLRELIRPYFDPPPAIHPDVPDPNEIGGDEDVAGSGKIAARGLRILLSAAHGLHDFEHYLVRFIVAFVAAAITLLLLSAVVAGVANL